MRTETATFDSDGLALSGSFFLPDDFADDKPQPVVIPCSGFTGLCRIHPARFARALTSQGYVCFGFDYRGFAESEGPRGRVILEEQVRDIIHGAAFAASDDRIDENRVILLGWGMGAGLCLDAARELPGVVGIAAVNGFYDGKRVQIAHRGEAGCRDFVKEVAEKRARRVRTGQSASADPFHLYPLDEQSREYVDNVLRKTPGYDAGEYSYELAESLLRWLPEAYAPRMRIPVLIAHGDQNKLHPTGEAEALRDAYAGPNELYWIEGGGHTEWMHDDDPKFLALADQLGAWISQTLDSVGK